MGITKNYEDVYSNSEDSDLDFWSIIHILATSVEARTYCKSKGSLYKQNGLKLISQLILSRKRLGQWYFHFKTS